MLKGLGNYLFFIVLLVGCAIGAGCKGRKCIVLSETHDKNYFIATGFLRKGQYDNAIKHLKLVISDHDSSPESSLLIGTIFLEHKKDYISAMYFFKKSMADSNNPVQVRLAEQLLNTTKKEFFKTFPPYTGVSVEEYALVEIANSLRLQNSQLREQLSKCQQQILSQERKISINRNDLDRKPPSSVEIINLPENFHIVESGETLSSISKKYYGYEKFAKKILDANSSTLKNPKALQIGQKLIIPAQ